MNDLIDRQAAIDEIKALYEWHDTVTEDRAVDHLKRLPSVQPEIIRCKDCDWWTKQEDSVQGRCALMQMYPAGGWYCGNARRRPE